MAVEAVIHGEEIRLLRRRLGRGEGPMAHIALHTGHRYVSAVRVENVRGLLEQGLPLQGLALREDSHQLGLLAALRLGFLVAHHTSLGLGQTRERLALVEFVAVDALQPHILDMDSVVESDGLLDAGGWSPESGDEYQDGDEGDGESESCGAQDTLLSPVAQQLECSCEGFLEIRSIHRARQPQQVVPAGRYSNEDLFTNTLSNSLDQIAKVGSDYPMG